MPSYFVLFLGSIKKMLLILLYIRGTQCKAINNGFSVKFNPILPKEDIKTPSMGAMFARIPQELRPGVVQELSKSILSQGANLGLGTSNQIAKIIFPLPSTTNDSEPKDGKHFINLPIVTEFLGEYKIVVATAPKNIRIGKGEDAKPVVIYVVFPEDDGDPKSLNIPSIYFVTNPDGLLPFKKKTEDPILVIDSNRTVTGLKSKAMTKFVKFKNKMTNQLDVN